MHLISFYLPHFPHSSWNKCVHIRQYAHGHWDTPCRMCCKLPLRKTIQFKSKYVSTHTTLPRSPNVSQCCSRTLQNAHRSSQGLPRSPNVSQCCSRTLQNAHPTLPRSPNATTIECLGLGKQSKIQAQFDYCGPWDLVLVDRCIKGLLTRSLCPHLIWHEEASGESTGKTCKVIAYIVYASMYTAVFACEDTHAQAVVMCNQDLQRAWQHWFRKHHQIKSIWM